MRRLTRYMLHQTLMVMLFVAATFTTAVWLVQSLRLLDLIVNRGLSAGLFAYLAILILPRFVDVVLPIAVFVAVLFVYNKLIAESELVVMRAAGLSPGALARPALLVGVISMAALYSLSLYILPASNRAFKDLQFEIRNRFASALVQESIFNTLSDHLMVYAKSRDSNGELNSLLISDTRDPRKPVTIFAERGAIVDTDEGPRILMVNGSRQQRDRATGRLSVLSFDKYTLAVAGLGEVAGARDRQPDERFVDELLTPAPDDAPETRNALFVELNMRLVGPLAALSMAAIPVACLLTGEFNRRGQARRIFLAIGAAFVIELLDIGLKNLSIRNGAAVPLVYLNIILPLIASVWLLLRGRARALPRTTPARAES